jgi:hypothetical protein
MSTTIRVVGGLIEINGEPVAKILPRVNELMVKDVLDEVELYVNGDGEDF